MPILYLYKIALQKLQVFYLGTGVGTGEYKEIIPGTYAFVDMGYDTGSMMSSNCSLIGSV